MSVATTRGIEVRVQPQYHPERSEPDRERWFFSYTVTLINHGAVTVQLRSRTWHITNARGDAQCVQGHGVVGEQPTLPPGGRFTYTSFCPLDTSLGGMEGSYTLETSDGEVFEARIAPFSLADPLSLH